MTETPGDRFARQESLITMKTIPAPIIPPSLARDLKLSSDRDLPHVGYWRQREDIEVESYEDALPWPGDHIDPDMPAEERERIAVALRSHPVTETYRGWSWDRIGGGEVPGCGEHRAGGYVYPEGLAYYVERYGLRLPEEFLAAVMPERDYD